jgi:hypothetical protein
MNRAPLSLWDALSGVGTPKVWRVGLAVFAGIAVFGLLADIGNTAKFGQIDLRNRVVGARVMLSGENPYTYLWQPGEPDTLLDPYPFIQKRPMAAVTVTPAVLSIHTLFAPLQYRYQKFLWLVVQLALFAGMVWLAMGRAPNPETRAVVCVLGLLFSCSTFWRLHVERGQVYVLFAFVTVLYLASFEWRTAHRGALGGLVLGLLVCLRPHMVMLGLPLLVYRRWASILGAIAGVGIGLSVPTMISRPVWPAYVNAMVNYLPAAPAATHGANARVIASEDDLPTEIEGSTNLRLYANFGVVDTTARAAVRLYSKQRLSMSWYMGVIGVGTIFWVFSLYRSMRQAVPIDYVSTTTLGLVLLIETLLPITRIEYSNMILLPIVLMVVAIRSQLSDVRPWEWGVILGAWVFSAPLPPWISAGFRGAGLAMVSQIAILLWAAFAPWRPLTPAAGADTMSGALTAGRQS